MDQVWQVVGNENQQNQGHQQPQYGQETGDDQQQESEENSEDEVNNEYDVLTKDGDDSFSDEEEKTHQNTRGKLGMRARSLAVGQDEQEETKGPTDRP